MIWLDLADGKWKQPRLDHLDLEASAVAHKIAAINDEVETCSLCGRTGLKRVAWVYRLDDGPHTAVPLGLDCASTVLGYATRVKGTKIPAGAQRQAVLAFIADRWRQVVSTTHSVSIRLVPGKFLRMGQLDLEISVEMGGAPFIHREPSEYGQETALRFAAQVLTRRLTDPLTLEWRAITGLASSPTTHEGWPSELKHGCVRLIPAGHGPAAGD